jgi:basic amino acid/polyamine antiporter, APA family
MEQTTQKKLVRKIGRWDFLALTISGMVGAGVFGLPAKIYVLVGDWSVLAYLACAGLVTLITLCFAEVGSRFVETGGPYLYARAAFGSLIGFEVGWLLWLARLTAFAALCNLLLGYISYFWPAAGSGWTRALVLTGVAIALTTVNVIGVRETTLTSDLFAIGKLAPLLLFVLAGFFFLSPHSFTVPTGAPPALDYGHFSTAVMLLIFAFSGFESAVIPAGEIRDPRRDMAFALLTATGVVALLYVMIQIVCIGTLPGLANSERPLVEASNRFLGVAGATAVSIGAIISVSGTLFLNILAGSRILYAMAEQGQLPRLLAATHRRFHTPHVAILISAAVMLVLTLQGTFMSALTISTVIRLVVYITTCVAAPALRLRKDAPPSRFRAPAGAGIAVTATTLSVWLLWNSPLKDIRAVGLAMALGLLFFFAYSRPRRSLPSVGESDSIRAS